MNNYSLFFISSIVFISCLSIITYSKDINQNNKKSEKLLMSSTEKKYHDENINKKLKSNYDNELSVYFVYKGETNNYCFYIPGVIINIEKNKIWTISNFESERHYPNHQYLKCGFLNDEQQKKLNEIIKNWDTSKKVKWYPNYNFCGYTIETNNPSYFYGWSNDTPEIPKSVHDMVKFLRANINNKPNCPIKNMNILN